MKIVYLNYLFDLNESSVGAAVHVKELEKALRECRHRVKTYYLNRFTSVEASIESKFRAYLKKRFGKYVNQINGLKANGRYFVKEWKIICQERPDVVLVRYNFLNFTAGLVARLKRVPFVLEVNAPMAYESRRFGDLAIRLPLIPELLERLNLLLADRVIVVSKKLKDFYVRWHIPARKIRVIPNGVDARKFHPGVSAKPVVSKYRLKGKVILGFVGSFHYWHGVENLIEFITTTLSRYDNVAFLLVGHGPLKKRMEELFEDERMAERVIFTGYVSHEEIPQYIAAMDVVLAPYPKLDLFYYSPLKLFEYMAAGKAVVASRIGQIAEIITDRSNGMLVEPDHFEELRDRVFELIDKASLRKRIGARAREVILHKYTWSHAARNVSDILTQVRDSQ